MGGQRPVAVPDDVLPVLGRRRGRRLARRARGQDEDGGQGAADSPERGPSRAAHALNISGRNSKTRRALTASLVLSTATHDS